MFIPTQPTKSYIQEGLEMRINKYAYSSKAGAIREVIAYSEIHMKGIKKLFPDQVKTDGPRLNQADAKRVVEIFFKH
jgi:hypothetical protein